MILTLDSYYFESDSRFSTSHDFKVAKILANDLIQVYIENQLLNLNKHIGIANSDIGTMRLQWTGSKTALIN